MTSSTSWNWPTKPLIRFARRNIRDSASRVITGQENLGEKQRGKFDDVFQARLQTGKAWKYKELLRDQWGHGTVAEATTFFKDCYRSVFHTRLKPMKNVARTIRGRLPNVVSDCMDEIPTPSLKDSTEKSCRSNEEAEATVTPRTSKRLSISTAKDLISTHNKSSWTSLLIT